MGYLCLFNYHTLFFETFVRTVYYFTASLYVKRRPTLYSLKRSSKLSQSDSTQQRITDAGVWHLQVRIIILLYYHKQTIYHFMTSSDRFPVPVRSAVKSNFTIWCCQNLSKCALNALIVQASTTELGKLFQIFTMRAEKKMQATPLWEQHVWKVNSKAASDQNVFLDTKLRKLTEFRKFGLQITAQDIFVALFFLFHALIGWRTRAALYQHTYINDRLCAVPPRDR